MIEVTSFMKKKQQSFVSSQLFHFLTDICKTLSGTKGYEQIYANFLPFSSGIVINTSLPQVKL